MSSASAWTLEEELLLRAAIGPPAEAPDAYARWRAQADLDRLSGGALRVLPLLGERAAANDDDAVTKQIARVTRFSWLKSQLIVTRALPGIQALLDAGIGVMLAKGAAVAEHTHGQLHLRPMDDFDIVVPRPEAYHAARVLFAAGYRAGSMPLHPEGAAIVEQVHALDFRDSSGAELDLHWQVIHGSLHRAASNEFWDRAQPATLRELPLLVLSPEDTFAQVVSHGQRVNDKRPLQWASDAALLLRGRTGFDWELVASVSERHRMARFIAAALIDLRELAPDVVPAELPRALQPPRRRRAAVGSGRDHWNEFVRRSVTPGERPKPGHAVDFAKEAWGIDRARDALGAAAWWASGRRRGTLPAVDVSAHHPLEPGEGVEFQAQASGTLLLGPGWWAPDHHGAWSRGREASLTLPLTQGCAGLLVLQLSVVPFLAPSHPDLTVRVFRDADQIALWQFRGDGFDEQVRPIAVDVSPHHLELRLRFVLSRRASPSEAGSTADHRPMGFALRRVELSHPT